MVESDFVLIWIVSELQNNNGERLFRTNHSNIHLFAKHTT